MSGMNVMHVLPVGTFRENSSPKNPLPLDLSPKNPSPKEQSQKKPPPREGAPIDPGPLDLSKSGVNYQSTFQIKITSVKESLKLPESCHASAAVSTSQSSLILPNRSCPTNEACRSSTRAPQLPINFEHGPEIPCIPNITSSGPNFGSTPKTSPTPQWAFPEVDSSNSLPDATGMPQISPILPNRSWPTSEMCRFGVPPLPFDSETLRGFVFGGVVTSPVTSPTSRLPFEESDYSSSHTTSLPQSLVSFGESSVFDSSMDEQGKNKRGTKRLFNVVADELLSEIKCDPRPAEKSKLPKISHESLDQFGVDHTSAAYLEKRRKNNEAARKSREKRKLKQEGLTQVNSELIDKIPKIFCQIRICQEKLSAKGCPSLQGESERFLKLWDSFVIYRDTILHN